jgi:flagellar basal-body rod protein FlgB
MNLNSLFGIHEQAANLRSQRSEILASNLANADTPGYKAKDIDFKEVMTEFSQNGSGKLVATNPQHITDSTGINEFNLKYRVPLQTSLDGNTVDTHVERGKFADNSIRYLACMRFLDNRVKNLMTAIRGE